MSELQAPPCPPELQELVDRFERNKDAYKSKGYKETEVRREFIDPFFKLLGWDVDNDKGYSEAYKEVVHEYSLSVRGSARSPDYCFRVGGQRKFFVEAKAPHLDLAKDPAPALQVRRYGWNAKLPLSILTDFEELVIYDTRIKPKAGDKPQVGEKRRFHFSEYVRRWDVIWRVFSQDAVLKGSFDREADSKKGKGSAAVDDDFLATIEGWRSALARNIALRNEEITQDELNFAVQTLIDRIIFLRICEDRGVEPEGRLQKMLDDKNPRQRLEHIFELADQRYNSGLFHLHAEKGRASAPDTITPDLAIDDKVLKEIVRGLYFPECPYEFSVLPPEILGHVYEQFLGKVIRLTPGHRAHIDEKPEVRKAGGVFYTPAYIVDHIIKNTLDPLLEGKQPGDVDDLRVVDPACGSGSFLIGAYQYLLDWYQEHYNKLGVRKRKEFLYETPDGWLLKTAVRRDILIRHIFGVDIDGQAVEVTKLSLLLKVLEKTSGETLDSNQKLFHERALPDLDRNIKCGNSLLDPSHLQQLLLDEDEARRVNAFDWKQEFPAVFAAGGFDAVVGNPPYIRIQAMKEWAPLEVELYKTHYRSAAKGNYDIYVCFVERGLELLHETGQLGYILPHKFFNAKYGEGLRGVVAEGRHLRRIVHFRDQQVFRGATTYTCLLFLGKEGHDAFDFESVADLDAWHRNGTCEAGQVARAPSNATWNFHVGEKGDLLEKLLLAGSPLSEVCTIFVGIQTSADGVYILSSPGDIEPDILRPFLQTGSLRSFSRAQPSAQLLFPYHATGDRATALSAETMAKTFPEAMKYLHANQDALLGRASVDEQLWWAYPYPKNLTAMEKPKLVLQVTARQPIVLLDEHGLFMTGGGAGPFYGIRPKTEGLSLEALLPVIASRLFGWFVHAQSTPLRGGYVKYSKQYIERFSIPPSVVEARHVLEEFANRRLHLEDRLAAARLPNDRTRLEREIQATDDAINALVYELYRLTEEEIALVQGTK